MPFIGALWGKALPYLIVGGVFLFAAMLFIAKVFGAGKAAERAEAGMKALQRTREANEARAKASMPVTAEEESRDPNNRDRP